MPQLAKGQTEVASCERWRRRHILRQKGEETPRFETKGGGDATFKDKRWRRRHFLRQKVEKTPVRV